MTSKISLCKQIRQDTRQQLWIPVLAGVVYLIGLVFLLLYYQSTELVVEGGTATTAFYLDKAAQIRRVFGSENTLLPVVSCTGAVICGMALFGFLFQRARTDFYLKLPMTRSRLFLARWLEGVLYYIIPTLVFYILAFVVSICCGRGAYAGLIVTEMVCTFLHNLVCFLLIYHTAILAAVLCGQILVALCGFGVLSVYTALLGMLVPFYLASLADTYRTNLSGLWSQLLNLSPAWLVFRYTTQSLQQTVWILVLAVLIGLLALVLFRRRPAERAGSALAFVKTRGVIRVLISVCVSLYAGLFLMTLTEKSSILWLAGGTLLSLVLLHGLIETIFDFDVKSALHHPGSLIGCICFCMAFIAVFCSGLPDRYIPGASQTASAGLSLKLEGYHQYLQMGDGWTSGYYSPDYLTQNTVLKGEDLQLVYDLIESSSNTADSLYGLEIEVDFRMKSGFVQKRTFRIDKPAADEIVAAIFDRTDYKETYFQILNLPDDLFGSMTVQGNVGDVLERKDGNELFNAAETAEFLEIFREELRELTYEDIQVLPAAMVEFSVKDSYLTCPYYIYPSQEKSLAWLEEQGIDFDSWKNEDLVVEVLDYSEAGAQLQGDDDYSNIIRLAARLEAAESWYRHEDEFLYTGTSVIVEHAKNGVWPEDAPELVRSTLITDPEEIEALLPQLEGVIEDWAQNSGYVYPDRLSGMDTDTIVKVYTDADDLDVHTDSGYTAMGTFVLRKQN